MSAAQLGCPRPHSRPPALPPSLPLWASESVRLGAFVCVRENRIELLSISVCVFYFESHPLVCAFVRAYNECLRLCYLIGWKQAPNLLIIPISPSWPFCSLGIRSWRERSNVSGCSLPGLYVENTMWESVAVSDHNTGFGGIELKVSFQKNIFNTVSVYTC